MNDQPLFESLEDQQDFYEKYWQETLGFDAKVIVCTCEETDEEWKGRHLCVIDQGPPALFLHFYPDPVTRQIVVLHIGTEQPIVSPEE